MSDPFSLRAAWCPVAGLHQVGAFYDLLRACDTQGKVEFLPSPFAMADTHIQDLQAEEVAAPLAPSSRC